MADGYDIQKWIIVQQKAIDNKLTIDIRGEKFVLTDDKKLFGVFSDVEMLLAYINGYEAGREGLNAKSCFKQNRI